MQSAELGAERAGECIVGATAGWVLSASCFAEVFSCGPQPGSFHPHNRYQWALNESGRGSRFGCR